MLDCMTCKWIKWSASIPLVLLVGAAGFLVLAQSRRSCRPSFRVTRGSPPSGRCRRPRSRRCCVPTRRWSRCCRAINPRSSP